MKNFNRGYQAKLKQSTCIELMQYIDDLLQITPIADEDKMHLCVLGEIKETLYRKVFTVKSVYTITFKPAQALALRLLFTNYIIDHTSHLGNAMHSIACEVHQQYI